MPMTQNTQRSGGKPQDPHQQRRVLDALREAARAGAPCPTNDALAACANCSNGHVLKILGRLAQAKAIHIEVVKGVGRRVTILDGAARPRTGWGGRNHTRGTRTDLVERRCLRCGETFMADGPWLRLCEADRRMANEDSGGDDEPVMIRDGRGRPAR